MKFFKSNKDANGKIKTRISLVGYLLFLSTMYVSLQEELSFSQGILLVLVIQLAYTVLSVGFFSYILTRKEFQQ